MRNYYAKKTNSGYRAVLGVANTVVAIPFPNQERKDAQRPKRMRIWFMDASDTNPVMGRMAISGDATLPSPNPLTDANGAIGTLAYIPAQIDDAFDVPDTQNYVLVASSTANAIVYISWFYGA